MRISWGFSIARNLWGAGWRLFWVSCWIKIFHDYVLGSVWQREKLHRTGKRISFDSTVITSFILKIISYHVLTSVCRLQAPLQMFALFWNVVLYFHRNVRRFFIRHPSRPIEMWISTWTKFATCRKATSRSMLSPIGLHCKALMLAAQYLRCW